MTQHGADRDVVAPDAPDELASRYVAAYDVDEPPPPINRAVRRRLPIVTAALAVLAIGAGGFFAGVRVEKSKVHVSSTGAGLTAAALAARFAGANAAAPSASAGAGAPSSTASGAPGGGAGPATGAGAPDSSGRANIVGTVTVVQGNTLYVTDATGNTVKVTTNSGTTITKTATGTMQDLAPGQSVVIRGVQSSVGVYAAQSVSEGSAGLAGGFGGGGFGGGGRGTRAGGTGTGTGAGSGAGTGATAAPSPGAGG